MIESPLIQELLAGQRHGDILHFLAKRFGAIPQDIANSLRAVQDEPKLKELLDWAIDCPNLESFRARLATRG
jgi:hypothetical protein